ncbi:hypothetical protein TNCV_2263501 [Trichonephila clavipes]|nr:hypothetical protein TNCV_2263501 [Trichonephila clavipes]
MSLPGVPTCGDDLEGTCQTKWVRERLVFLSTGTSRTLDSQTPGSRTAVHVLMGEKKCLERRNLTESTIVRRSIDLPVLFESCRGSAHTRP